MYTLLVLVAASAIYTVAVGTWQRLDALWKIILGGGFTVLWLQLLALTIDSNSFWPNLALATGITWVILPGLGLGLFLAMRLEETK